MVSRGIIGGLLMITALLAAMPAQSDTTLNVRGSDGLNSTIQVRNGKGRMSVDGMSEYLVYDSRTGTITYVEPGQQQYTQVSMAELEATMQTAASMKDSMRPYIDSVLAGLSAEQRKMIERRMGGLVGAPAAGKPAGITTVDRGWYTFAGLRCKATGILKNGHPAAEVCMAMAPGGKLSDRDFAVLEALVDFSRTIAGTAGGMLGDLGEQLELLAVELDGVPIAVRDLEHGKRYQVTAVSNARLYDSGFNGHGRFRKQDITALLR